MVPSGVIILACGRCGVTDTIYWLVDSVWHQIHAASQAFIVNGRLLLCPECAEIQLKRPLTLDDLDIGNYRKMAGMPPPFIQDYVRATVSGACQLLNHQWPSHWPTPTQRPHIDGAMVGEKLARQTNNPQQRLNQLVLEVDQYFP